MAVNNDDGTVIIESDYVMHLSALNMRSDSFFLVLRAYHFLTDDSLQSAEKDQQESRAVAEKPHDAVVKFDTLPIEFTAASRGPPCDSTALVSYFVVFILWY